MNSVSSTHGRGSVSTARRVLAGVRALWQPILTVLVATVCGVILFPIVILVSTAVKSSSEYFEDPLAPPTSLRIENFLTAWVQGNFGTYVTNSVIVVFVGIAILIAVSLLAAYALVELDLPGSDAILLVVLLGFMVPPQVLIAPLFPIMDSLGWLNHHRSLIAVYVAFAIPFSVFFFRQYFLTISSSYGEAARLNGCTEFQVFSRIYLPLSIPAIATVFVFQFVLFWNEFLYAIVFITETDLRTAPAGLSAFQGQFNQNFTLLAAGIIIASVPAVIVFLVLRKYFIRGFVRGQV